MRVATYNIHSGRAGIERVAEVLRATRAEALALTEVRREHLKQLARALDMRATLGRTYRFRGFGNAILTREPHHRVKHVRFTRTKGHQPRAMLAVRLDSGMTVTVTHLGLTPDERLRHAKQLMAELGDVPDPLVLAGDLNEQPSGMAVALLRRRFEDAFGGITEPSFTYPAESPLRRIDYVLVSGMKIEGAAVLPTIASDHLPVVADLV